MIRAVSITVLLQLAACAGPNSDKDGDGLTKELEELLGLDPNNADSDGDGLDDGVEVDINSDPLSADGDADGLTDGEELDLGLDPNNADTDGDGLSDGAELDFQSDRRSADSDDDGLTDGEEYEVGTDPNQADSDDDGYPDFDEVRAGSDPADEDSRIYKGGWPYNPDKDSLPDPGFDSTYAKGNKFPRFKLVDHHGDTVDSYDFALQGKKIVIDLSVEWAEPCNALAAWLSGNPDSYYDSTYPGLDDMVKRGEVFYLTLLVEDEAGEPARKPTVTRWHNSYPNPNIPVLADTNGEVATYVELGWWPTLFVLDEDMTVLATQAERDLMSVL